MRDPVSLARGRDRRGFFSTAPAGRPVRPRRIRRHKGGVRWSLTANPFCIQSPSRICARRRSRWDCTKSRRSGRRGAPRVSQSRRLPRPQHDPGDPGAEGAALHHRPPPSRPGAAREKVEQVLITIVADLQRLEPEAFWFVLDNRGWMHPFDEQGRRRGYDDIPKSVDRAGRRSVPFAGRRATPRRRLRQGHDAVQRVPVGRFPAPADETKGRGAGFRRGGGAGADLRQKRGRGISARLVRAHRGVNGLLRSALTEAVRALHLFVLASNFAGWLSPVGPCCSNRRRSAHFLTP